MTGQTIEGAVRAINDSYRAGYRAGVEAMRDAACEAIGDNIRGAKNRIFIYAAGLLEESARKEEEKP